MKIAIISDIHDNIWTLERVLIALEKEAADALVCCGDLCSPFIMRQLIEGFKDKPIHIVLGNNDGDHWSLTNLAHTVTNITLNTTYAEPVFGEVKTCITHFPDVAKRMARSGDFNLVLYGHSHKASITEHNGCLAVNPGEVMGRFGKVSYAMYDSGLHQARIEVL